MHKTTLGLIAIATTAMAVAGSAYAMANMHDGAHGSMPAATTEKLVQLKNNDGQNIGTVTLKQGRTGLLMEVDATGLTPGWHGIHIHETGQCEGNFTSAGAHINHPEAKVPHGLLNEGGPDDGDLPNIFAGADGVAKAEIFTDSASLTPEGNGQWLLDDNGAAQAATTIPANRLAVPVLVLPVAKCSLTKYGKYKKGAVFMRRPPLFYL